MPEPDRSLNHSPYDGYTSLWDDIQGPVASLAPGASAPDPIVFGPAGSIRVYGFDGGVTSEMLDGQAQMPHSWQEGSEIHPHIHYCATTTNTGSIRWGMEYYMLDIGDVAVAPVGTLTAIGTADGTPWKHQVVEFGPITATGKEISTVILYRIYRSPGSDTYTDDAAAIYVDFHIRKDGEGSVGEYTK